MLRTIAVLRLRWCSRVGIASAFGTFETCQLALRMSAYRGRPEVVRPMVGINAIDRSGIVLTRAQVALAGERA